MPSITECCTTPLPFCHLFSIPVTECCTAPLPFRHLSCADCPLSCCHLSVTVLPAQLVILCYASFAYCRPALHVIYHYPPQEEPPCPQGGKREIEY
ncbi:hypothetical protein Pint_26831 [Pistacia integerrima]|uniref:Uncharacterized protein n=1 Tax=Pistacia integerrima TaxID=434235 RepID=A0ACC0YSP5_9ROSI|nr:hypothetical protein Pint_26831 [Pistacia integerrima]